ncbi:dipeptidase [Candidatus Harpocratesius sp.]
MVQIADIHIHPHNMIPQPFRLIYRYINRKEMPPWFKLSSLKDFPTSDLCFTVVNAVGDKIVTGLYGFNAYHAVKTQLKKIRKQAEKIGALIYQNPDSIKEAEENHQPLILLAVEGGDFLNERIERIREIHDMGVRAITIVHSADNCIGYSTLSLPELFKNSETLPVKKYGKLTDFGKKVIEEMNLQDIIVDIAHSCEETAFDAIEHSNQPIIASHTGALALQPNFPRYISDELIKKIAEKQGIIGVWPFYINSYGTKQRKDLAKHAKYISSLIGSKHVAIGTDINGLPGIMENFHYPADFSSLKDDFIVTGISENEVSGILGENFTDFLRKF